MMKVEKIIKESISVYTEHLGESGAKRILKNSNVTDIRNIKAEMIILTSQVERRRKYRSTSTSRAFTDNFSYRGDNSVNPWNYQKLSFSKAFLEDTRRLEVPESAKYQSCSNCSQTGRTTCLTCQGKGQSTCLSCRGNGKTECNQCNHVGTVYCYYCSGTGRTDKGTCSFCSGAGRKRCPNCSGFKRIQCTGCSGTGTRQCSSCSGYGKISCNRCGGHGGFRSVLLVESTSMLESVWSSLIPQQARMAEKIRGALKPSMRVKVNVKEETANQFSGTPNSMSNNRGQVNNLLSRYSSGSKYRVLNQRLESVELPILQFNLSIGDKNYEASCIGKSYELIIDEAFLKDISDQYEEVSNAAISEGNIGKALKWLHKKEKLNAPGASFQSKYRPKVNRAIFESIQFAKALGLVLGFGVWSWLHFLLMNTFLIYPNWRKLIFVGEALLSFIFFVLLIFALRWKPKIAPRSFKYHGALRWTYFALVTFICYIILSSGLMAFFYLEKMGFLFSVWQ